MKRIEYVGMSRIALAMACMLVLGATGCSKAKSDKSAAEGSAGDTKAQTREIQLNEVIGEKLTAMSSAFKSAPAISYTATEFVDERQEGGYMLQRSEIFKVSVLRPAQFRVETEKEGKAFTLWYNAGKFVVVNAGENLTAQEDIPETLDQALAYLAQEYGASLPGGDLLHSDPFSMLLAQIESSEYVGKETIDEEVLHHFAFTQMGVTWELWVTDGATPMPRRLLIVNRQLDGDPHYESIFTDWNLEAPSDVSVFTPNVPASAKSVKMADIAKALEISE